MDRAINLFVLGPLNILIFFFKTFFCLLLVQLSDRPTKQKKLSQNFYKLSIFLSSITYVGLGLLFGDQFALQIIQSGLMSESDYIEASKAALSLFEYGQVLEHALFIFLFSFYFAKSMIPFE